METLNVNETMENLEDVIVVEELNSGSGTLVKVLIGGTIVLVSVAALRFMKNRKKNIGEKTEKKGLFRRHKMTNEEDISEDVEEVNVEEVNEQ